MANASCIRTAPVTGKRTALEAKLDAAGLPPNCRAVADYWLSLWDVDALPARENFRPAKLGHMLRNVVLLDVVPDASARVRLAGTGITKILGIELTGADWLAAVTGERRLQRLHELTQIAKGAIAVTTRTVTLEYAEKLTVPEIVLPFRPPADGGPTQVLYFLDWFSGDPAIRLASAADGIGAPIASTFIALNQT
jgi:hypothetical protein